jgi:uncharacterized membrane protein YcfT
MLFRHFVYFYFEEFEDTKTAIIIRKSKERQHNGLKKRSKKNIISILMVIVHSFLGSKYQHVHTFENFVSARTRKTKLIYYLYSEILMIAVFVSSNSSYLCYECYLFIIDDLL